jgi:uncharacterized protein (UPF0276 family)
MQAISARAGVGVRAPHYREILETKPDIGWVEVHSENYFGDGGQPHYFLTKIREQYPLSLHGVGLSLGSSDRLNREHLAKLKNLVHCYEPEFVSEHVCWCSADGRYANDLLPLPYTEEALQLVCARIQETQEILGRQILIENVSSYLQYAISTIPEWEFLAQAAKRTGCGILLDVNNIYVNSVNFGFDPLSYLHAVPAGVVKEIHLAGFDASGECLIDTHGAPVAAEVWALYAEALARVGNVPTLIEWDTDIPKLGVLLNEARKADVMMQQALAHAA